MNMSKYKYRSPEGSFVEDDAGDRWPANFDRFVFEPAIEKQRFDVLCMDPIFPVPEPMRMALIDRCCPEAQEDAAKVNPKNKACLSGSYWAAKGTTQVLSRSICAITP